MSDAKADGINLFMVLSAVKAFTKIKIMIIAIHINGISVIIGFPFDVVFYISVFISYFVYLLNIY